MRTLLLALVIACNGTDPGTGDPPLFPADYATAFQEVRDCRPSVDHDVRNIRVYASPDAVTAYTGRTAAFPTGALLVKAEYGLDDELCAGAVIGLTAMEKLAAGTSPSQLDWKWQQTDPQLHDVGADIADCSSCHSRCGNPPNGYGGTCAVPP